MQNDFTKYFSSETDFFDSSGTLKYFQFGHHLKYVINEKYKYENYLKHDTNDQEESEEVDINKVEEQRFTSTQDL